MYNVHCTCLRKYKNMGKNDSKKFEKFLLFYLENEEIHIGKIQNTNKYCLSTYFKVYFPSLQDSTKIAWIPKNFLSFFTLFSDIHMLLLTTNVPLNSSLKYHHHLGLQPASLETEDLNWKFVLPLKGQLYPDLLTTTPGSYKIKLTSW